MVNHNFCGGLGDSEPLVGRRGLLDHAYGYRLRCRQWWQSTPAASFSPASGLEVVFCVILDYFQMSTGRHRCARLDSRGALRKPKMVLSPYYKSCFIGKTLHLFSFRQPPYQSTFCLTILLDQVHVETKINTVDSLNGNCTGLDVHRSCNAGCWPTFLYSDEID